MNLQSLIEKYKDAILKAALRHGARDVRIFGSVARGDEIEQSDVDVLVNMEPGRSLFDMGGLLMELEQILGCKVDLVTEKGLKPRIRDRVLREAVRL
jgi:hypothetical protein